MSLIHRGMVSLQTSVCTPRSRLTSIGGKGLPKGLRGAFVRVGRKGVPNLFRSNLLLLLSGRPVWCWCISCCPRDSWTVYLEKIHFLSVYNYLNLIHVIMDCIFNLLKCRRLVLAWLYFFYFVFLIGLKLRI